MSTMIEQNKDIIRRFLPELKNILPEAFAKRVKRIVNSILTRLRRNRGQSVVFCYAEGDLGNWEAFCPSFHLAIQGDSFNSVMAGLEKAIQCYLAKAMDMPLKDRSRLLRRRAPPSVWVPPLLRLIRAALTRRDDRLRHEFTLPAPWAAFA